MRTIFSLFLFLCFITSCTKEVPEAEKKLVKATNESEIRKVVENYSSYFNSGNIDSALHSFTDEYTEYVPDVDSPLNITALKTNLLNFRSQNPEGKLGINIEDIFVSDDLAAVQIFTSYLTPDPIEGKMNPVYSERSIKLLRKSKTDGWQIFRSLSSTAFSYD